MSYDFIVYTRSERLPSRHELTTALESSGGPVIDDQVFPDLASASGGFVPVTSGGEATGFELSSYPITTEEIEAFKADLQASGEEDEEFLHVLTTNDVTITFRCRDDREIEAAHLVAEAVARLSNGVLCDPQTDTMTEPGSAEPA